MLYYILCGNVCAVPITKIKKQTTINSPKIKLLRIIFVLLLPSNKNLRTSKKEASLKRRNSCWKKKNNVQQQHNYVVFFIHRMYLFLYDFFVCFVAVKYLWCSRHFPEGIDKKKLFFLLLWYLTNIKPDEDILNFYTLTKLYY